MPATPLVSVLVPCCNVGRYAGQCLDSLSGQTLQDIEIICVNDGSTDDTADVLRAHAAADGRIRIIDKENTGYGDSMNRALACATGEYVGIVESDDWAEPDMFRTLHGLARDADADLVRGERFDFAGGVSTYRGVMPREFTGRVVRPLDEPEVFLPPTYIWTGICRRSWLEREGLRFLPTHGASYQDISFNFKTLAAARRAVFTERAFVHYRRDNEASSVHVSRGKAWCVCDEYAEIERFLASHGGMEGLYPYELRRKYEVYYWNFRRLDIPLDARFCMRASEEFAADFRRGRFVPSLFKPRHARRLARWARHPWLFLADELLGRNGLRKIVRSVRAGGRNG